MEEIKIVAQLNASLKFMKQNNLEYLHFENKCNTKQERELFRKALKLFALTLLTDSVQVVFTFDRKDNDTLVLTLNFGDGNGQKILSCKYPQASTTSAQLCEELQKEVDLLRELLSDQNTKE